MGLNGIECYLLPVYETDGNRQPLAWGRPFRVPPPALIASFSGRPECFRVTGSSWKGKGTMAHDHPFLDFKAIRARAPITDVLSRYQVHLNRVNQTTLKGNCPLPSHGSNSKNTFFANEPKSVWYCHSASCKKNGQRAGGNVIDLVASLENLSAYEAAKRLGEWFPAGGNPATVPATIAVPPETGNDSERANMPLAFTLKDIDPAHRMIQERGISVETAKLFGVGLFPGKGSMAGRIVFPLYERGQLVGYTRSPCGSITAIPQPFLIASTMRFRSRLDFPVPDFPRSQPCRNCPLSRSR